MLVNGDRKLRIAFIVKGFPEISETFLINQVADLLDQGVRVEIFALERGASDHISSRHAAYRMADRTHYLLPPASKVWRVLAALPAVFRLLCTAPGVLKRALDIPKCRAEARSLRLFYLIKPFIGKRFDLVHCHFGGVANRYLEIKDVLKLDAAMVTTFYGYDVSQAFREGPADVYDRLKRECELFFVMSNNMKQRVVAQGFPTDKVKILPVSIDVQSYPFAGRSRNVDKPIQLISVARFVEKKGLDDLLRALAIVRQRSSQPFRCSIVGSGPLDAQLRGLSTSLGLDDVVDFKGYMSIEKVIQLLMEMDIMVQPSKTASDGDME